ncbi:MAG: preprotein translocase subunit SecG [Gammaproteobacteria bacterium]
MWQPIVIFAHVFVAVAIIALILLQQGKGADAGAAFGAGASGTVFGAKGSASFLSRATGILATVFFATSLTLAYFQGDRSGPSGVLESLRDQASDVPALVAPPAEPLSDVPVIMDDAAAPVEDLAPADDEGAPDNN